MCRSLLWSTAARHLVITNRRGRGSSASLPSTAAAGNTPKPLPGIRDPWTRSSAMRGAKKPKAFHHHGQVFKTPLTTHQSCPHPTNQQNNQSVRLQSPTDRHAEHILGYQRTDRPTNRPTDRTGKNCNFKRRATRLARRPLWSRPTSSAPWRQPSARRGVAWRRVPDLVDTSREWEMREKGGWSTHACVVSVHIFCPGFDGDDDVGLLFSPPSFPPVLSVHRPNTTQKHWPLLDTRRMTVYLSCPVSPSPFFPPSLPPFYLSTAPPPAERLSIDRSIKCARKPTSHVAGNSVFSGEALAQASVAEGLQSEGPQRRTQSVGMFSPPPRSSVAEGLEVSGTAASDDAVVGNEATAEEDLGALARSVPLCGQGREVVDANPDAKSDVVLGGLKMSQTAVSDDAVVGNEAADEYSEVWRFLSDLYDRERRDQQTGSTPWTGASSASRSVIRVVEANDTAG
ncbi:hypothetical protein IWX50DRAFT_618049 [Phyllosticta citricarpa]